MKKVLIGALVYSMAATSMAEVSSSVTLTSDYSWRGVTQTSHDSAVQGSLDYSHSSGVFASVWSSSLGGDTNLGQEVDLVAGYSYKINDMHSISLSIVNFTYTRDSNAGWAEYTLGYSSKWFDFSFATTNEYYGDEDNGAATYMNISKSFELNDGVGISLAYGIVSIGDEDEWSGNHTGYSDYKIGISKTKGDWTAELFHTNTMGREVAYDVAGADPKTKGDKYEQDSIVGFSLSTSL